MSIENEIEEIENVEDSTSNESAAKSEKTKSKKGIKSVVSGDFLMDGLIQKNLSFILFVAFLMLIYVAYGYFANNTLRSLAKEEKRSEELYSKLQSMMEVFDKESLQSKIAERVKVMNLVESKDPPRVIWIEEE
jgi:hypothetical protein